MSLKDFGELGLLLGIFLGGISLFILLTIGVGGQPNIPGALTSKKLRDGLVDDYKSKKVVFGGPLGIVKGMLKISVISAVAGAVLYAIAWMIG